MNVAEIFETMNYGPAPENNDTVEQWLDDHERKFSLFIDGEFIGSTSNETHYFTSVNPANGQTLAQLIQAVEADVDAAVAAAQKAQAQWWEIGGHARARYLYAIARLIQKRSRPLAVLESMDNGKPIRETRDIDVNLVARHFYYHAGWAQLMDSEFSDLVPLGVVGQIIPWNFPLLMAAWKIAPALASGNCVVLKPAEFTSLSALMLAEIIQEAQLPRGVVNIVTGDGQVGETLVRHPKVDKIAFTGSTEVGRIIRTQTAGSGKKISLELGGKSPFIVFDDCDQDSAIEGLVDAIWFNQGQVCCAGSRLLVQESIAPAFIDKLKARMETLRVGDPLDKNTDIGAIVDPLQKQRITALVEAGISEGATLWQAPGVCPEAGCFYPPTLLLDVETSNTVAQEEIFGPVLSVLTFRTQSEAVDLANNSRYGLAASIWSENINRDLDVAAQIKAGVVWINSTNLFDASCGFGGYRESGFGREGGREGLYEYVKAKANNKATLDTSTSSSINKQDAMLTTSTRSFIDQTAKLYIGGKQVRADNGNTRVVKNAEDQQGTTLGEKHGAQSCANPVFYG